MSLSVYARINRKSLSEELMDDIIFSYFLTLNNIVRKEKNEVISYEKIDNKNSIIIFFIKEKKPPYNIYDSDILCEEFEYQQLVIFDITKEECSVDTYKNIINFCRYMKNKINSSILITSDAHDEICILQGNRIIWAEEKEHIFG